MIALRGRTKRLGLPYRDEETESGVGQEMYVITTRMNGCVRGSDPFLQCLLCDCRIMMTLLIDLLKVLVREPLFT